MANLHKFRLTLFHSNPGFFGLDCNSFGYEVNRDIGLEVFARDSDELVQATKYHIDCGGFESEELALAAGEKLRKKLRLLNSVLDLGLVIHTKDELTGKVSESVKSSVKEKGGVLLDSRVGLSVIPDDGLHGELVTTGSFRVRISDPIFLLDAVKKIWDIEFKFDEKAEDVVELLNLSSAEASPKLKFLTAYLALEQLITIKERSEAAKELINSFIKETNASGIPDEEKASLVGSLSNLTKGSFSGALKTLSKSITNPKEIQGYTPEQLASKAIGLRNKIAHKLEITSDTDINAITTGIREMTLGLLWSEYKLPNFSIYRPADSVSSEKLEMRIL
jgi:hypothetical protein